jgi:hypothetical protein
MQIGRLRPGVGVLLARAIPFSGEPLERYVERLAALFGFASIGAFLAHCAPNVAVGHVMDGGADRAIAKLVDLPDDTFANATIRRISATRWRLNGEEFGRRSLAQNTLRICPMCLAEDLVRLPGRSDMRAHFRTLWRMEAVCCCPTHGVNLLDLEADALSSRSGHPLRGLRSWTNFASAPIKPPTANEDDLALVEFIAHRLGQKRAPYEPPPLLQGLSVEQVLRICEELGALSLGQQDGAQGVFSNDGDISSRKDPQSHVSAYEQGPETGAPVRFARGEKDLREAVDRTLLRRIGFGVLRRGPVAFDEVIGKQIAAYSEGDAAPTLVRALGPLYVIIADSSGQPPLKHALRKIGLEFAAVSEAQTLFRGFSEDRARWSAAQAARHFGAPRRKILAIANAFNPPRPAAAGQSDEPRPLERAMMTRIWQALASELPIMEAAHLLNVSARLTKELFCPRLFAPFAKWSGGEMHLRETVANVVKRVRGEASPAFCAGRDEIVLTKIGSLYGPAGMRRVIALLYLGKIKATHVLQSTRGLTGVLVSHDDVRAVLGLTGSPRIPDLLSSADAAFHLKTSTTIASALVSQGVMRPAQPTRRAIRRHSPPIPRSALEFLERNCIAFGELDMRAPLSQEQILSRLSTVPSYGATNRKRAFFPRMAAEAALELMIGPPAPGRLGAALLPAPRRPPRHRPYQLRLPYI